MLNKVKDSKTDLETQKKKKERQRKREKKKLRFDSVPKRFINKR